MLSGLWLQRFSGKRRPSIVYMGLGLIQIYGFIFIWEFPYIMVSYLGPILWFSFGVSYCFVPASSAPDYLSSSFE